jgi:hypothetical protein
MGTMANRLKYLVLSAALLVLPEAEGSADSAAPRFCVLPVESDFLDATEIVRMMHGINVEHVQGLQSLVFLPLSNKRRWMLDASRRLVPYEAPFPRSYLDQNDWVFEPWSGRVVAAPYFGPLSVLRPGQSALEALALDDGQERRLFGGPFLLPRRELTIVTSDGKAFVVGETGLRPWMTPQELKREGIERIGRLTDAPSLKATIVEAEERRVLLFADDGSWQEVGQLGKWDTARLYDLPPIDGAVYFASRSIFLVRREGGAEAGFHIETIAEDTDDPTTRHFWVSQFHGQLLRYDGGGLFSAPGGWQAYGLLGFETISGGDIGSTKKPGDMYARDLPSLGRTLITGAEGFYLYDGQQIVPVVGGGWDRLGGYGFARDLPTLGRVMVNAHSGVFELSAQGELLEDPLPFIEEGFPRPQYFDWPEAGVALVVARNGIFALDREGTATPVTGSEAVEVGRGILQAWAHPATGDLVIGGSVAGLFVVIDGGATPDSPCS